MKSLFLITLLSLSAIAVSSETPMKANHDLNMQLEADQVLQKMVKVYDYNGGLISQFPLNDIAENKIKMNDHMILEESDFAFDYQGDYYYLGSADESLSVIN